MIKHITEDEQRLTNTLRTTTEALTLVTAERDDLLKLVHQSLDERDHYVKERDKLAAELKSLRDSGVKLPVYPDTWMPGWTRLELEAIRDYGDRRAAAERERCAKVCSDSAKHYYPLFPEASGACIHLHEAIRKGE